MDARDPEGHLRRAHARPRHIAGVRGRAAGGHPHACRGLAARGVHRRADRGDVQHPDGPPDAAPPHVLGDRYIASAKSRRVAGYENGPRRVTIEA